MAAMFDFKDLRDIVAYPFRFVLGDREDDFTMHSHETRRPIHMRWRRGDDGKLESRWECDE
jgi:hypothetical protein